MLHEISRGIADAFLVLSDPELAVRSERALGKAAAADGSSYAFRQAGAGSSYAFREAGAHPGSAATEAAPSAGLPVARLGAASTDTPVR
jgi:hypothetical protein